LTFTTHFLQKDSD